MGGPGGRKGLRTVREHGGRIQQESDSAHWIRWLDPGTDRGGNGETAKGVAVGLLWLTQCGNEVWK